MDASTSLRYRGVLKDEMTETIADIENTVKSMAAFVAYGSASSRPKAGVSESNVDEEAGAVPLPELVRLLEQRTGEIKDQLKRVPEYQSRQRLIEQLEAELKVRDQLIVGVHGALKDAESSMISSIFQMNEKLKSIKQGESRPVNTDELIRFAHKISKTNAVAAPHSWTQGDPDRPYPTELEMKRAWPERERQHVPVLVEPVGGPFGRPQPGMIGSPRGQVPPPFATQVSMGRGVLSPQRPPPSGGIFPTSQQQQYAANIGPPPPYGAHRHQFVPGGGLGRGVIGSPTRQTSPIIPPHFQQPPHPATHAGSVSSPRSMSAGGFAAPPIAGGVQQQQQQRKAAGTTSGGGRMGTPPAKQSGSGGPGTATIKQPGGTSNVETMSSDSSSSGNSSDSDSQN